MRERATPRSSASARRNNEEKEGGETAEKERGRGSEGARKLPSPEEPTRRCHATRPQEAQDSRPRHALPFLRHALMTLSHLLGSLMLAVSHAPTYYLCDPTYYLAICSTSWIVGSLHSQAQQAQLNRL